MLLALADLGRAKGHAARIRACGSGSGAPASGSVSAKNAYGGAARRCHASDEASMRGGGAAGDEAQGAVFGALEWYNLSEYLVLCTRVVPVDSQSSLIPVTAELTA